MSKVGKWESGKLWKVKFYVTYRDRDRWGQVIDLQKAATVECDCSCYCYGIEVLKPVVCRMLTTNTTIYILQLFHWQSACAHFIHLFHNLIILIVKLLVLQWQALLLVCVGKGKAFLGGWQTFADFCPEVVATTEEDCDKTLTRRQNLVAKFSR